MQAGGSSSYEASCDAWGPEEADEPQLRLCGGQIWRADPGAAHRLKPAIAGGRQDPPTGRRRMADLVELIDALGQHITDCPPRRRSSLVKGVNSNAIFLFRTLFFRTSSQSHNDTPSLTSRRASLSLAHSQSRAPASYPPSRHQESSLHTCPRYRHRLHWAVSPQHEYHISRHASAHAMACYPSASLAPLPSPDPSGRKSSAVFSHRRPSILL